uniref:Ribosomal_L28e domain-containing protein n=1 Tax=Macrostomum lignano TaxID=282301 RepID=A0A1I8FFH4_9PLAT
FANQISYRWRIFSHFRTKAKSKYREIKLSRRQRSFELPLASALTNWEKFRVILTRDYTSRMRSAASRRLRPAAVSRELPWESDEVKRLKRQLDQRQQLAKSIRDPMRARSQRPPPEARQDWALKPAPSSPTARSASGARR